MPPALESLNHERVRLRVVRRFLPHPSGLTDGGREDGSHLTHDQRADSALWHLHPFRLLGRRRLVVHELVHTLQYERLWRIHAVPSAVFARVITLGILQPRWSRKRRGLSVRCAITLRPQQNFTLFPRGRHDSEKNSANKLEATAFILKTRIDHETNDPVGGSRELSRRQFLKSSTVAAWQGRGRPPIAAATAGPPWRISPGPGVDRLWAHATRPCHGRERLMIFRNLATGQSRNRPLIIRFMARCRVFRSERCCL